MGWALAALAFLCAAHVLQRRELALPDTLTVLPTANSTPASPPLSRCLDARHPNALDCGYNVSLPDLCRGDMIVCDCSSCNTKA